ncbi:MAG: TetR/AcrR family transcriptional regulator [Candidatus Promineifilaceae bacterium]
MARKTKQDWLTAGATILLTSGAQGLTIDALLKEVGKTKGSFYHHFKGYDDYIAHYLRYFEQEGTLNIIEVVSKEATPQLRLHKLISVVTSYPSELEAAMRAWAFQDERVWDVFERVDQQRVAYVWEQFRPIVNNDAYALTLARTLYALLVGSEHMLPPATNAQQCAMFNAFLDQFGIPPVTPAPSRFPQQGTST